MRVFVRCLTVLACIAAMAHPALSQIDYERLDARLEHLAAQDEMVGLAVAIVENGETTFARGYGETHIGGLPVTENTRFRWASLSKGVAGSLTGLLAQEGALSLDDKISKFSTSLRLPGRGEARASLIDLLAHRLGIVPNAYDGRIEDGRKPTAVRRQLAGLNYVCPLSTCHTYQNVAFDAIGEVLTSVSATSYEDLAASRLFTPLGMTSASVTRDGLFESGDYARPYTRNRGGARPKPSTVNDVYYGVPAAGGVNSSIRDLATYMRAQMGLFPDVLPQSVLDTIQFPRIPTLREKRGLQRRYGRINSAEYGLGWRVYDYQGHRVVGHRGAVRGYRALILFDPERKTGVAAMWNSSASQPVGLQFEVMDMVYNLPREDWMKLGEVPIRAAAGN